MKERMKKTMKKTNKGFSLVELIIVIAIMAILAGAIA
ncbi:MAG: prepilin-type N-terminal cleavage/methylation domain-containing protein, partial [Lachnospiraceae bacterium]|nr:prepilin-type N-terminal cleavage/methylation domain-containing protein [Lachnospiraceae bacterium]